MDATAACGASGAVLVLAAIGACVFVCMLWLVLVAVAGLLGLDGGEGDN